MTNLSLQDRFALIALNALNNTRNSTAKKAAIRCISAADVLDRFLNETEEKAVDSTEYLSLLQELPAFLKEAAHLSSTASKELEHTVYTRLHDLGLMTQASALVSCDLEFASAGNKILEYRTDLEEYSRQTESIRAELMEEGNVTDETVCLLWLLRESSCFYDLFSKEGRQYLSTRINELYLNSLLAKTLLPLSIHSALDSAALGLFSKKKSFFSTQLGTGVLFQVPFMERSSAVFIESEELYCNAEKRLENVVARLEANGNEVHIIRAGSVPLLQIDNLYYECIPTQRQYYRAPVFGVQLRRYVM